MTTIGYARVSSEDQNCELQVAALHAAGCEIVRSEKKSGTTTSGRAELETVLSFLRKGDTLMVVRIDRLARSVADLEAIVARIHNSGAHLRAVEQPIDTSSAGGRAFLQMLSVFSEFETALRRERQLEGIRKAKIDGRYRGRKPSVPSDEVRRLRAEGVSPTKIATMLKIGRASVYRALSDTEKDAK